MWLTINCYWPCTCGLLAKLLINPTIIRRWSSFINVGSGLIFRSMVRLTTVAQQLEQILLASELWCFMETPLPGNLEGSVCPPFQPDFSNHKEKVCAKFSVSLSSLLTWVLPTQPLLQFHRKREALRPVFSLFTTNCRTWRQRVLCKRQIPFGHKTESFTVQNKWSFSFKDRDESK